KWLQLLPRIVAVLVTFLLVTLGWVVFRAPDLATALVVYKGLVTPDVPANRFVMLGGHQQFFMLLGLALAFLPLLPPIALGQTWLRRGAVEIRGGILVAIPLALASIAKVLALDFNPFLY